MIMEKKDDKIPEEILKDLDINEVEDIKKDFSVTPIVETHQIKLPVPKQLVNDLELDEKWKKGKKIKLKYDEEKKELKYKI